MKINIGSKVVWVNYHHLFCFFTLGKAGSLTKASQELGIGASALSIQMKQFEENIGQSLFERSHRKLVLNEVGVMVFSYAKEIFRLGGEMMESVYDRPSSKRVHLRVGTLDTIPKHLTLQLAKAALKTRRCSISIVESKPDELLQSLSEHQIDIVLTNASPRHPSSRLYSKRIARLPLWVVGGRKFAQLRKGFPESLQAQPFILPTADSSVRHEIESSFHRMGVIPDYIAEAQDVMVQKLLALEELGMTVAPEFAVKEYVLQKKLFLLGKLEDSYEELFLVSASRKIENPIASELMREFALE